MDLKQIDDQIVSIKKIIEFLEKHLQLLENIKKESPFLVLADKITRMESQLKFIEKNVIKTPLSSEDEELKTFTELRLLLKNNDWANAVDPDSMCLTEEDKIQRAENIIESTVGHYLENLKFLDFGCGEGHVNFVSINQKPSLSVGYDIVKQGTLEWEKESPLLTTNYSKVKSKAPYDIILVNDVIDHMDFNELIQNLKELSDKHTIFYVQCHPFSSRHGGHLYRQINKAFAHVIFTPKELEKMGFKLDSIKNYDVSFYKDKLMEHFDILLESTEEEYVENFFSKNEYIQKRMPVANKTSFLFFKLKNKR